MFFAIFNLINAHLSPSRPIREQEERPVQSTQPTLIFILDWKTAISKAPDSMQVWMTVFKQDDNPFKKDAYDMHAMFREVTRLQWTNEEIDSLKKNISQLVFSYTNRAHETYRQRGRAWTIESNDLLTTEAAHQFRDTLFAN